MSDPASLLEPAIAAVRRAAAVCRTVQAGLIDDDTLTKNDRSPVTVADFASQAVVCDALATASPHIPMVAEEGSAGLREHDQAAIRAAVVAHAGPALGTDSEDTVLGAIDRGAYDPATAVRPSERHWTLDPIDGTKGFLREQQYAVALALIEQGRLVLGVLACPSLPADLGDASIAPTGEGVILTAVAGGGAQQAVLPAATDEPLRFEPVRVSDLTDPAATRFCESVESGHSDQDASAQIARRLGIVTPPVRMDSQCKYAAVARGDASIYLRLPIRADYIEKVWDHAAGALVVAEAGGMVTDIEGHPLDFTHGRGLSRNRGVIATNGAIHDAVVAAVGAVVNA